MQINYTSDAFSSLVSLVNFIETTNTLGAGLRWLNRFENFLVAIREDTNPGGGNLIFTSADANQGWNGFYKSTIAPTGNYVWLISLVDLHGKKLT